VLQLPQATQGADIDVDEVLQLPLATEAQGADDDEVLQATQADDAVFTYKRKRQSSDEQVPDIEKRRLKMPKRRWTEQENSLFFASFGKDLSAKLIPSGKRLSKFGTKIGNSRTVAQIRAKVYNFIKGLT